MNYAPAKLQPMQAERAVTFRAWLVQSDGLSRPLGMIDADGMDEAAEMIVQGVPVGRTVTILMQDAGTGRNVVRTVKVARRNVKRRWSQQACAFVEDAGIYARTLAEYRVQNFAPAETFDALRDDPVGHDFTLVEGR